MRKFYQIGTSIACELRIGNYVRFDDMCASNFHVLDEVPKQEDELYIWIEPIPLTEEWLLKFGFEKKGVNRTRWAFWEIDLVEDEKGIYSFDESRIYIDIKYVHQLQNLYFALTNGELTYEQQK